ncbi:hypothetical protein RJ639_016451 [Escallonia herrerae]|uniref:Uncharacterized protein n=1 Tax=Escallonia herrerae TaxID=1293975 RepID=A0AA89AJE6_9ASTE|nr:hypothetical protein RJ639_016451 [Escallonia herrerae]
MRPGKLYTSLAKALSSATNPRDLHKVHSLLITSGIDQSVFISACGGLVAVEEGQMVHGLVEKIGIKADVVVNNGLLSIWVLGVVGQGVHENVEKEDRKMKDRWMADCREAMGVRDAVG